LINSATHDNVTRNHERKWWLDLIADVAPHFKRNGPWRNCLPTRYQEPEITAALKELMRNQQVAWGSGLRCGSI
jgi:hypothetical protein